MILFGEKIFIAVINFEDPEVKSSCITQVDSKSNDKCFVGDRRRHRPTEEVAV